MEAVQEAVVTPVVKPERKNKPVIMPDRVGLAEHKRNDWVADLPMSVTLEEALEPSFWSHKAMDMVAGDNIELRAEDGSWYAQLKVVYCERTYAKVKLMHKLEVHVNTDVPEGSALHSVLWKGPRLFYCVVRNSDSKIVREGEKTKESAYQWMREHEKAS